MLIKGKKFISSLLEIYPSNKRLYVLQLIIGHRFLREYDHFCFGLQFVFVTLSFLYDNSYVRGIIFFHHHTNKLFVQGARASVRNNNHFMHSCKFHSIRLVYRLCFSIVFSGKSNSYGLDPCPHTS